MEISINYDKTEDHSWDGYVDVTKEAVNISIPLQEILQQANGTGQALDLGAGTGKDTLALLEMGWNVTAIDISEKAISTLEERTVEFESMVRAICGDLTDIPLASGQYQLINATAALPYFGEGSSLKFQKIWDKVVDSLAPGGEMALQFFGNEHSWQQDGAGHPALFHSRDEIEQLLKESGLDYSITEVHKEDYYGIKHWHEFLVTAKKSG